MEGGAIVKMINQEKEQHEQFVTLTEKFKVTAHDGIKRNYEGPKSIAAWEYELVKVNEAPGINGTKKLKCLVIRDSFTMLMIRYLQEHYSESVFIHGDWKYEMHEDLIEKEKPDVMLTIIFETGVGKLIEFPFKK